MVNTGKPSPGCFTCRSRRIKCDEGKPECRKCRKRGWKCPGYRDPNALRIVDETEKCITRFADDSDRPSDRAGQSSRGIVIPQLSAKAQAKSATGYPSPIPSPDSVPIKSQRTTQAQKPRRIRPCISTPIGEQVFHFFLSNFVLQSSMDRERGYLDFLFPLMRNQPEGSPLPLSLSAAALAAFVTRQKASTLLPRAEAMYTKALEATHKAIGDSTRARDNSTLASVALLSTFEQLRPSRPSTQKAEAFGSHLDGAVALLKARGKDQFKTDVGRRIFVLLRSLLTSRTMAYATPLDPQLYTLTSELDQDPTQKRYAELSLKVADLRSATEHIIGQFAVAAPTPTAVLTLLQQAGALDLEYEEWFDTLPAAYLPLPPKWINSKVSSPANAFSAAGRIDTYVDMFACFLQNWARTARLYIHSITLRCLAWVSGPDADYRNTAEYRRAQSICSAVVTDIVASVPFVFGWAKPHETSTETLQPASVSGIYAMWFVFVAGSSDFATEAQRVYLKRTLNYIAEEIGIGQAKILAGHEIRIPSMMIGLARMKQLQIRRMMQAQAAQAAQTAQTGAANVSRQPQR